MRILDGPIQFWDADDGATGGGDPAAPVSTESKPPSTAIPKTQDVSRPDQKVEGERPPDFSSLKLRTPAKAEDAEKAGEPVRTPEAAKTDKGAGAGEKAATGDPGAKATPPKEAAKPPKAGETPQKPAEPKREPEKPKVPTEEEIEAKQPRVNASPQDVTSFKELKEIAKTAVREAKARASEVEAARKEVETIKAQVGKLPEEVEKELADHRAFRAAFDAENSTEFQQEIKAKVESSEKNLYDTLTKFGANVKADGAAKSLLDEIKEFANGNDITSWPRWPEIIDLLKNPLDRQELIDSIRARAEANRYKDDKLKSVYTNREQFLKQQEEKTKTERTEWAKHVENKSIELAAPHDWINPRDIPQGISEEEKKAIEEHNKAAQEHAQSWQKNVIAAYNRDPDKTAEIALKAIQADVLSAENEKLTTKLAAAEARSKELEQRIAKITGAGRLTHVETAVVEGAGTRRTTEEEGKIGGDGESAIRGYAWGARRK